MCNSNSNSLCVWNTDVLKTRLQLQPHSAHAARLGILGMSGHVLQTEGVASLAKGMGPSLARGML